MKESIKDFIIELFVISIIVIILMVVLKPTAKDKEAYKRCIQTYDKKTCQKMTYGN